MGRELRVSVDFGSQGFWGFAFRVLNFWVSGSRVLGFGWANGVRFSRRLSR